jgi:hypothetical protein
LTNIGASTRWPRAIKVELGSRFPSRRLAEQQLFEYIEGFYNTRRLHSGIGYRTPAEVELEAAMAPPRIALAQAVTRTATAARATASPTLAKEELT